MPLTETAIRIAKAEPKPYKISDSGGMYLLVHPNGSKYFRYDYRFAGKRKTAAIGVYPDLSLKQARVERDRIKSLLSSGFDPSVHSKPQELSEALTFALDMEVDLSLPAGRVIRTLNRIMEWRGKPSAIRCDNGPEYVSASVRRWAEENGIKLQFIQPGKPQQNAFVERFNRTVRYEWLSQYDWNDLEEVRIYATQWMYQYNHERPHMALGGMTPIQRLAMAA